MRYITLEEFCSHFVKAELIQLTESKTAEPDIAVLDQINEDAASEIDDYLRGIYPLPLQEPTPRSIKTITADIMKYRLYQRRNSKNLPKEIFEMYRMALNRLGDIQKRKQILDIAISGDGDNKPSQSSTIKAWNPTPKYKSHFTNFDQD